MPKKQVGRPSSADPTFISEAASANYSAFIVKRPICLERGFELKSTATMGYPAMIHNVIKQHNWRLLCSHPQPAYVTLVREFCANFPNPAAEEVAVRGKGVMMGPDAINGYYELEAEDEDDFHLLKETSDPLILTSVLDYLCYPGAQWRVSRQGAYTFDRNFLKPAAKVWYQFLQASLMPTTHNQTVSRDRALLLYCILEGKRIDVGKLLYGEICANAPLLQGTIWFPALIAGLCINSGVGFYETEETVAKGKGPLTLHSINRITKGKAPQGQEEEAEADPPASPPQPPAAAAPPPSADAVALLQQKVDHLDKQNSKLQRTVNNLTSMLRTVHRHEVRTRRYIARRDDVLARNLKVNSKKFFTFPDFPPVILESPPPTPSASEDASEDNSEEEQ